MSGATTKKSGETKTVMCEQCGKEFTALASRRARFCSDECRYAAAYALKKAKQSQKEAAQRLSAERLSWGINYGEKQKQETLRMLGSIK